LTVGRFGDYSGDSNLVERGPLQWSATPKMTSIVFTFSAPFLSLAQGEAQRTGLRHFQRLAPDVLLAQFLGSTEELARLWRQRPPIYVRHFFPVEFWERPRCRELQVQLRTDRPEAAQVWWQPFRPDHPTLYVLEVGKRVWAGRLLPEHQLSPWPWGVPHFVPDPDLVNRAEWKLMEAISLFGLRLGGRALDLGASPGGWSRVLTRAGMRVTAVDPHPRGMRWEHPYLQHRPLSAQDFLAGPAGPPADLIVNDMWLHAEESAELMVQAAPRLRPGGMGILTLKLGNLSLELESKRGALRRSLDILRRSYRIPRLRQLFYNRNEVTAWLRR